MSSRGSEYVFDPATGKWTKVPASGGGSSSNSSNSNDTDYTPPSGGDDISNPDDSSSSGIVEKTYYNIELNTLVGTISFIATEETIKLKAGDTVKLKGLGSYLSGNYYVKDVTRQISSSDGYTHSATLIRPDFKSLKVKTSSSTSNKETKPVSSSYSSETTIRTYTVKQGDNLWTIAKQYYGDGSLYTKIYDANTGIIANPDLIYVGQVLVIP